LLHTKIIFYGNTNRHTTKRDCKLTEESLAKQNIRTNKGKVKMLLLVKQGKVTYAKDLIPRLKVCRKTIYGWKRKYAQFC